MSLVKKEARLSGMLLARKGTALPAHTDHKLNMQAMESALGQNDAPRTHQEIESEQTDHSILIEAVKEINDVTKRQYNKVVREAEADIKPAPKVQEKVRVKLSKPSPSRKNEASPAKDKDQAGKRIAMTLRMDQNDHLKLRLYAAHSRKSCQEIISAALDMYISEDNEVCDLSDCNCLTD